MMWLLKRGENAKTVHVAVQEGGGGMILMMTQCGLSIRWDQPHKPWVKAKVVDLRQIPQFTTCKRCRS